MPAAVDGSHDGGGARGLRGEPGGVELVGAGREQLWRCARADVAAGV